METIASPVRIRAKFWLPLPGVADVSDEAAVVAALPEGHPVKVALSGGGVCLMEGPNTPPMAIPVRAARFKSLTLRPCSLVEAGAGVVIQLGGDLARLTHAWESIQEGVKYPWGSFLKNYHNDLGTEAGRRLRRLLFARCDGLMGHSITDARLPRGSVGLTEKGAGLLLPVVQRLYPNLGIETVQQMDGLRLVLQRFPVDGNKGCRWVTLRLLDNRPDLAIYVNAVDWNKLHGGDEDGDQAYLAIPSRSDRVVRLRVNTLPDWPALVLKNNESVIDALVETWMEENNDEA